MSQHKTLIFHIGDHKTGSTSIQHAFAKGQVRLQGHSVFYPAKVANNALRVHCLNYGNAKTPEAKSEAAHPLERLAKRVRNSKADFVLLSAEALERVPAALLREITDRFFSDAADEIRIIAYVRPHAGRITSTFTERTKIGVPPVLKTTLEDFTRSRQKDGEITYLPRFQAWREQYGEAFTLRPMIRNQLYRGSVVDDFVHHAFGGIPFAKDEDAAANESLHLEDLMRLKVLQSHLNGSHNLRLMIGWEIYRLINQMPPPLQRTKLQLHRSLAKEIQQTCLADARDMDRAFFQGQPLLETELNTAVEKAIAAPQSTDPSDYFSTSELRSLELMSSMISGLLELQETDWPAFLHQKRVRDLHGEPTQSDTTTAV